MARHLTESDIFLGNNEIDNREALVQEYMDICGYSREDAIEASESTLEYDQ